MGPGVLVIRADAGPKTGAGHVMRCLALAEAWRDRCGAVIFALSEPVPGLEERILHEAREIRYTNAEPGSPADAVSTVRIARDAGAAWVVADGYRFGDAFQQAVHDSGLPLLVVDDYGQANRSYADIVLNQNNYANRSIYREALPETRFLIGMKYALLRREFAALPVRRRTIPKVARRILVTFGGADPLDLTRAVLRTLTGFPPGSLEITAVVGGVYPHNRELEAEFGGQPRIIIRRDVTDMPALMQTSDLAISASGSTCWELAFLGLPSIVCPVAENQAPIAEMLAAGGMAISITPTEMKDTAVLTATVSCLVGDPARRETFSRRMQELVDGEGAGRVVMAMTGEPFRLRRVQEEDSDCIYRWINDHEVRALSFRPHFIEPEEHRAWFSSVLTDSGLVYFIAVGPDDRPFGQARFRIEGSHAVISVLLEPASRNRGLGYQVIAAATARLFATTPVTGVSAFIKTGNEPSRSAFMKAGYESRGTTAIEGQEAWHLECQRSV